MGIMTRQAIILSNRGMRYRLNKTVLIVTFIAKLGANYTKRILIVRGMWVMAAGAVPLGYRSMGKLLCMSLFCSFVAAIAKRLFLYQKLILLVGCMGAVACSAIPFKNRRMNKRLFKPIFLGRMAAIAKFIGLKFCF